MNCPRCHVPLREHTVEGVSVQRCERCRGLWLSEASFHAAKETTVPDGPWLDLELWSDLDRFSAHPSSLECPQCSRPLAALRYDPTGVELGFCGHCHAIWLDEGNLRTILKALDEEARRLPAQRLLAVATHEALEALEGGDHAFLEWKDAGRLLRLLEARILAEHPTLTRLVTEFIRGKPLP